ncbi:MAG: hypothetical protein QXU37_03350, partial [Thermoplasmata archaeon]
ILLIALIKFTNQSEFQLSYLKLINLTRIYYNAEIYVKEKHEKIDFVRDIILRYTREIIYADT